MPADPTTAPDIWRAGALSARQAARYLGVTRSTFFGLARANRWPRKRIKGTTRVIVYPKSVLRAFLAGCEDA